MFQNKEYRSYCDTTAELVLKKPDNTKYNIMPNNLGSCSFPKKIFNCLTLTSLSHSLSS